VPGSPQVNRGTLAWRHRHADLRCSRCQVGAAICAGVWVHARAWPRRQGRDHKVAGGSRDRKGPFKIIRGAPWLVVSRVESVTR
jgi:hypothetical protein